MQASCRDRRGCSDRLAFGRLDETGRHFDGGAFASSIGAEVAETFAGLNRKADAADRGHKSWQTTVGYIKVIAMFVTLTVLSLAVLAAIVVMDCGPSVIA